MNRLVRNIVYNIVGQGVVLLLGFVSVKHIYARLGGDTVGVVFFALMANTTLCNVLELGVLSTTVREVSANCETHPKYTHEFIRSFSSFYWILYVVFGVVIYLTVPYIAGKWLKLGQIGVPTAAYALRILLISALLGLPKSFYSSVIRGLQRMEINNIIESAAAAMQQLGIIAIIWKGGGLVDIAYWLAAVSVLSLAAYLAACACFFPVRHALIPGYSKGIIQKNINYTAHMTVISLTALAYLQADKIMLSKILPIDSFGYYYFAYSVAAKGAAVTMAISNAAFPHVSNVYGTAGMTRLADQYHELHDALCLLIAPIFAAVAFATFPLYTRLFSEPIARSLLLPNVFLALGFYITGTLTIPNAISFAVGKPEIVARQNLLVLFLVLPVAYFSIRAWGITGASLSMVVYGLFCYFYSIPRICAECIGISANGWYAHILKNFFLIGATYGASYLALALLNDFRLFSLTVAYGASTIVMVLGSRYLFGDIVSRAITGNLGALPKPT